MSRRFQKAVEDFRCEHCGWEIRGSGYTNHCPQCLYSRHVDIMPGDRRARCGGLMEPERIEQKKGRPRLIHRCLSCGYEKKNKTEPHDNFEVLLRVVKKTAEKETNT